jgi:hypothetical protein
VKRQWVLVAHTCNPTYSRGGDQENCSSKPTWANKAGGVAQVVAYLPSKFEALSSNPMTTKKKKKVKRYPMELEKHHIADSTFITI